MAASNGLLIRNRGAFEGARKLQAIIFDKTGTLTEGRFGVTDTLLLFPNSDEANIDEAILRKYTASVDANSEHPIAKAIADSSEEKLAVENLKVFQVKALRAPLMAKKSKWLAQAICANKT